MSPKGYGHSIDSINGDTRSAVCAICGPVDLHKNGFVDGEQRWKCANANRVRVRADYVARAFMQSRVRHLQGHNGSTKVVSYE